MRFTFEHFYSSFISIKCFVDFHSSFKTDHELDGFTSPATAPKTENLARNTRSYGRSESSNGSSPRDGDVMEERVQRHRGKSHLISPDFTPEKLEFRSRPGSPKMAGPLKSTYKAPKMNKGCLVETIERYHSGVAKLGSPQTWRNATPLSGGNIHETAGHVLESRVMSGRRFSNPAAPRMMEDDITPRKRFHSTGGPMDAVGRSGTRGSIHSVAGGSGGDSPSKRRGSGGAYCVECKHWRHKFDFTKSQWRNRPRGFRRCKFCTGEAGSDSKVSPADGAPRRYRMKSGY